MEIDVSRIVKVDGASMEVSFNERMEELDAVAQGLKFDSPVSFEGKIANLSGLLKLDGRLNLVYTSECCRCLKKLTTPMSINIKEDFVNVNQASDNEVYTYEGNSVSIYKALKDNIVLNLPVRQLCSSDCKGLCSQCGHDMNIESCDCCGDDINPQMIALKDFFKV